MSAAAFAKGLLDLEVQLTPILVSLVSKDSSMLDGLENASTEIEAAKARLNEKLTKKITEQVRLLAKDEDEKLAETSSGNVVPPYDITQIPDVYDSCK
ncbi:hypothetical protein Nepgr_006175 [Nepenthes gracilis]|uniref:Uncharacterized protein n=1 Tax=Nepenthes gracilis TaxID=150966 RepID=A0AAD3XHC2_NEPGR|nr:hypothetical protein Nepgr_006175 [Nepenthes gracilis]